MKFGKRLLEYYQRNDTHEIPVRVLLTVPDDDLLTILREAGLQRVECLSREVPLVGAWAAGAAALERAALVPQVLAIGCDPRPHSPPGLPWRRVRRPRLLYLQFAHCPK